MLYRKIMAVCSQIHTKHINKLCGQNVEFLNVKPGGTYSDHCKQLLSMLQVVNFTLPVQTHIGSEYSASVGLACGNVRARNYRQRNTRHKAVTAVLRICLYSNVTTRRLVKIKIRFGGPQCHHLQGQVTWRSFETSRVTLRKAQHPRRPDLQLHSPDTLHDTNSHYKWENFLK